MSRARICPNCRRLNSPESENCFNCGARFPGKLFVSFQELSTSVLGSEAPLTRLYLIICVLVYAFAALKTRGVVNPRADFSFGGLLPSEALRWGALANPHFLRRIGIAGAELESWRFLSAVFVHFGLFHIGANMFTFHYWGRGLEGRIGSARFLVVFLGTGVVGFLVSHYWFPGFGLTAGASGGLTGLMGAFVGYLYAHRDPAWKDIGIRVVLFCVVIAFAFPQVNNAAHGGGFVSGLALGFLFGKEPKPFLNHIWFRGMAAALLLATPLSIVLSHASPVWKRMRVAEIQEQLVAGRSLGPAARVVPVEAAGVVRPQAGRFPPDIP